MRTASRLGVFGLGLVAAFGLAAAVGTRLGPIDVGASSDHASMLDQSADVAPRAEIAGLAVAANGYRLVPAAATLPANVSSSFTFRIEDSTGLPHVAFDELYERRLHLIVLSRNLVAYSHLHPSMDPAGTWSVDVPPLTPGSYRVYADFEPTGADRITLAVDVQVAGLVPRTDLPAPATINDVDGYNVTRSGDVAVRSSSIVLSVDRDGTAVVTEPYLGEAGHLVVVRVGDLGYLHVRPVDNTGGSSVRFIAEFPTPGIYRFFFDFAHDGEVHTASFTVEVPTGSKSSTSPVDTMPDH